MTVSNSPFAHTYAVILAGGSGTRFWPLSRRANPKQLLSLFGKQSLLEQTAQRIRALVPPERIYVFTNTMIHDAVRRQLPQVPEEQIVAEPASRNTAPAIGLAAFEIARRDAQGVMMVLPSDHVITKPGMFRQALAAGRRVAEEEGRSVVIGIKPSRPETGYGYIRLIKREGREGKAAISRVRQFTEKPPAATARRYVRSRQYLWNAGMFIWKASTLISNLDHYQPQMAAGLRRVVSDGGIRASKALKHWYPRLPNISIDYALMEHITNVWAVAAADMGWSDVGSWAAAYELNPKDADRNVCPRSAYLLDCHGNMIVSSRKFVGAAGIENLIIVETDDALLVCSQDRSQDVGKIVRELERRGIKRLL
jgi:mannose-1-phosphate guanylyltransferase